VQTRADAVAARMRTLARSSRKALALLAFGVLPAAVVLIFLTDTRDRLALDFHHAFWPAGRAVLDGTFSYPRSTDLALGLGDPFVYPPLMAVLFAPFGLLDRSTADWLYTGIGAASLLAALRLLGVRDWRCYGIVFVWPPVLAALQAGNLSLLLVLLLGCLWRVREHRGAAAVVAAVTISAKLFLWPVVVWLVLTKRYLCGAYAVAALVVLNAIAWGVADGGSLVHYIRLLRRLAYLEGPYAYTVTAFAQGFGVPLRASELITWSCVGVLLYAAWRLRSDEGRALAILVVVALVASPIVWLHYFALLAVPVALTRKSLSWHWFVPLALLWCPGQWNGTQPQTGLALLVLAVVAVATVYSPAEAVAPSAAPAARWQERGSAPPLG
jgi:alpha-1,2-mannosyltransferase